MKSTSLIHFRWLKMFPILYFHLFFNINLFILRRLITILYWFCHTSTWICHRYTSVPHPEPLSLLPPHTIPLGRLSVPAPSIQYHALNLDWRFVSYMILYMFQCHSPKSSHPLLSHRVQKTVEIFKNFKVLYYSFNFHFYNLLFL